MDTHFVNKLKNQLEKDQKQDLYNEHFWSTHPETMTEFYSFVEHSHTFKRDDFNFLINISFSLISGTFSEEQIKRICSTIKILIAKTDFKSIVNNKIPFILNRIQIALSTKDPKRLKSILPLTNSIINLLQTQKEMIKNIKQLENIIKKILNEMEYVLYEEISEIAFVYSENFPKLLRVLGDENALFINKTLNLIFEGCKSDKPFGVLFFEAFRVLIECYSERIIFHLPKIIKNLFEILQDLEKTPKSEKTELQIKIIILKLLELNKEKTSIYLSELLNCESFSKFDWLKSLFEEEISII